MNARNLYIVIPVFNRYNFTSACLESLRLQSDSNFKVIVVDDGSTDGTFDNLKKDFPEVLVLRGTGNLFWTASVNLGIRKSLELGADFVMTLNNDLIVSEDLISSLRKSLANHPMSIIGSLEIDAKTKSLIYVGERINWLTASYRSLVMPTDPSSLDGIREVTHLPGRAMVIPKKVFLTIGLFAETQLPHYMADYDFTHQARRAGFKILIDYGAKVYTYPEESGDTQNRVKKTFRNYINHLTSIRGGANLKDFSMYAVRNCPIFYLPTFLFIGYIRRIVGYFVK